VSAQLLTLDNICARRVARHKNMRLHTGPSRIRSERATGITRAGNRELGCAEMFSHRNCNAHPTCLEALCRIERLVFDPKINVIGEFASAQQSGSAFA
jgi:hypothetical protein